MAGHYPDPIAAELTRIRREQGLTGREVAARIGVSQPQLSFWETGARRPLAQNLADWAQALGYELTLKPIPNRKEMTAMDFGAALHMIKDGRKLTREGWNGRGQFVVHQKGYPDGIPINTNTAEATGLPEGTVCRFRPYLMLAAADGSFVPWTPSVSDVLAEDWATAD